MGFIPRTPVSLQQSTTHYARAVTSSGITIPSLKGGRPKTPLLAGSICGGVVFIAWCIGFAVYFRKRYRRKKLKRAAAKAGLPTPDVKSKPQTERLVIPPDPAVFLGQARPGHAFVGPPIQVVDESEEERGRAVADGYFASGGPGASGSVESGDHAEKGKPLLLVMTEKPDISTAHPPVDQERQGSGASRPGSR